MAGCASSRAGPRRPSTRSAIGRNDRVAIVLPNGPEMATAFVAIACSRHDRAAQPGLPRGRVRLLSHRPQGQGAGASPGLRRTRPWRSPRATACTLLRLMSDAGKARRLVRPQARRRGHQTRHARAGLCTAGRRGARAAHVRHDLAPEDRAAAPAQCLRLGAPYRRNACADAATTAASTSCRCSTSTG